MYCTITFKDHHNPGSTASNLKYPEKRALGGANIWFGTVIDRVFQGPHIGSPPTKLCAAPIKKFGKLMSIAIVKNTHLH
jgi:hypothetical protein